MKIAGISGASGEVGLFPADHLRTYPGVMSGNEPSRLVDETEYLCRFQRIPPQAAHRRQHHVIPFNFVFHMIREAAEGDKVGLYGRADGIVVRDPHDAQFSIYGTFCCGKRYGRFFVVQYDDLRLTGVLADVPRHVPGAFCGQPGKISLVRFMVVHPENDSAFWGAILADKRLHLRLDHDPLSLVSEFRTGRIHLCIQAGDDGGRFVFSRRLFIFSFKGHGVAAGHAGQLGEPAGGKHRGMRAFCHFGNDAFKPVVILPLTRVGMVNIGQNGFRINGCDGKKIIDFASRQFQSGHVGGDPVSNDHYRAFDAGDLLRRRREHRHFRNRCRDEFSRLVRILPGRKR